MEFGIFIMLPTWVLVHPRLGYTGVKPMVEPTCHYGLEGDT
jgi:hypothetical protein